MYAVVDVETTGLFPGRNDRIAEIGIVHVDADGTVTGKWNTLVNPERDLGAQHIHGIRASEIRRAPTFADIAGDVANLLAGRVFVAHNASFDTRFVVAEFQRAGYWFDSAFPSVCTMALGAQFGLGGSPSLARTCERFGISNPQAHSAGADAEATAHVLGAYLRATVSSAAWDEYWERLVRSAARHAFPSGHSTGVVWQPRGADDAVEPHFLGRIAEHARHPRATGVEAEYLAVLDRCLLDRVISGAESDQLVDYATDLGLSRSEVERLHTDYLRALAVAAWADQVITPDERADITSVATLLGVDPNVAETLIDETQDLVPEAHASTTEFALKPGDMIVLTGEMAKPRAEWESELRSLGFATHSAVTKKVKLLVAADADTLSGKARNARDYGIPIVTEAGLARLLA